MRISCSNDVDKNKIYQKTEFAIKERFHPLFQHLKLRNIMNKGALSKLDLHIIFEKKIYDVSTYLTRSLHNVHDDFYLR